MYLWIDTDNLIWLKIESRRIKELKLYIVEFDKDGIMKFKIYLSNCIVNNENH